MNAAFRHLSVRLWLTAISGGVACISLLPWWQQIFGVGWLALPAAFIMSACFAGVGWVMNRVGLIFLNRHVNEATVWERAGMMADAETAYRKAMAAFDSFWLSPILRRGKLQWFSGVMARFNLGQQGDSVFARRLIATHLKHFPGDNAVAEPWLEHLAYESHLPQEHEAVARVSDQLADHRRIQRLLMQYYLINGRIDFDAQQTYRRVWKKEQPLPEASLLGLARLLRNDYILSHWALQVYMAAYESGDPGAIEGISAAVKWLPATEESRPLLKKAETIIEGLSQQVLGRLDPKFKPAQAGSQLKEQVLQQHPTHPVANKTRMPFFSRVRKKGAQSVAWLIEMVASRRLRRALPGIVIVAGLIVVAMAGWRFFSRPNVEPIVAKTVVEEKIVVTDPFTIQVAAYLKPEDAQRFVDQLQKKKLDAFWTQAKSANRTWYQVKVSHFVDREGAQKYGQELKSKGLIDDFYVANYVNENSNSQ